MRANRLRPHPLLLSMILFALHVAAAQNIHWKSFDWKITSGPIGGGIISGSPANVTIDAGGALHLRIQKLEGKWTGAELFTQTSHGFGTYQWVLQGDNFYAMESQIVLGLFTYGPTKKIGVDGENEIDTEFSNWDGTASPANTRADFTSYPATGYRKANTVAAYEDNFYIAAPSTPTTTVRMTWSPDSILWEVIAGTVPLGTAGRVLKTDTFHGTVTSVPQAACPVGINFWSYKVAPTRPIEVVVQDFRFVPWKE